MNTHATCGIHRVQAEKTLMIRQQRQEFLASTDAAATALALGQPTSACVMVGGSGYRTVSRSCVWRLNGVYRI